MFLDSDFDNDSELDDCGRLDVVNGDGGDGDEGDDVCGRS
jgi:hypothetical protein